MEIKLDILQTIASGETKPTRIMFKSNITWSQLQTHMNFLINNGYVEEKKPEFVRNKRRDKRTKTEYGLTREGESIIRYFRKEIKTVNKLISLT